ncbi:MAG: outer membrane lipoprotein chaperone LolA [Magnetococcales bacterium]|nr:outer membrane lipoprotein chaperone LolA [Magnetococcales bacterium]
MGGDEQRGKWRRWGGVGLLLLALWPVFARAGEDRQPLDRLQAFLSGLKSIDADFVQQVTDPASGKLTEYRGRLTAVRPNLFRWDYRTPYVQLIVSDGQWIWHYEPELRQATRVSASQMEKTPAGFLITGKRIEDSFDWKAFPDPDWKTPAVTLHPLKADGNFQEISVTLDGDGGRIRHMIVVDNLGNRSRFTFQDMRQKRTMEMQEFHFVPPAGVDIVAE